MQTALSFQSMLVVPTNASRLTLPLRHRNHTSKTKWKASCSATPEMGAPTPSVALLHCHGMFLFLMAILLPPSMCSGVGETNRVPPRTINQGDTVNSTQHLWSNNQKFELGFFTTGTKSYLSISLGSLKVWIANRDRPILDDSGVLLIDNKGRLVIQHSGSDPILLYSNGSNGRVSATLQDNGNLVLSEFNPDGSTGRLLWQSFDYPTDSLLPGMKLGYDYRTGRDLSLTSWLSEKNPSTGTFTLHWDPREQVLVFRNRAVAVWKSGALKNGTFEHIPQSLVTSYILMINNSSSDGSFFSYFRFGTPYWQLNSDGELIFQVENVKDEEITQDQLYIFETCYAQKNTDYGCVGSVQPKCRSNSLPFELRCGDFRGLNDEKIDGTLYKNASIGIADCNAICWNDCDCVGYSRVEDTGCQFWKGQLTFVTSPDYETVDNCTYVLSSQLNVSLKPMNPYAGHRWKWKVIIPAVSASVLIFVVSICWVQMKCKGYEAVDGYIDTDKLGEDLRRFSLESIEKATRHFSTENKLGEGGFGPVYKGKLPEGLEIAVKRLSSKSGQGQVEFKNELFLVAKLQHTNLVRLLGYCIQGEEKILIYEYMPNKSLDSFIFDPSKSVLLDWRKRINIIEGIAQGLLYLHQHSRLRIVHRDLKAGNILLDADFNPKISDFGMARMFQKNELNTNTNRIVGTYGYMPPEYVMKGIYSVKSDVFSFGVLVLEILSGRRNTSFGDADVSLHLIQDVWELWLRGTWQDKMESTLKETCPMEELQRIVHIALSCVENSRRDRPTMSEVISMLTNESLPLPLLKEPAFLTCICGRSDCSDRNILEYHTVNGLTMSGIVPR